MFVFGCFRIPRNVAAGVAAGLVLLLAAPACAPSDQGPPESAVVGPDRVDSDRAEPVLVDTVPLVDVAPEPSPTAASVPVSDSVTDTSDSSGSDGSTGSVVDQLPVVSAPDPLTTPTTVPPTTTTPPTSTAEGVLEPVDESVASSAGSVVQAWIELAWTAPASDPFGYDYSLWVDELAAPTANVDGLRSGPLTVSLAEVTEQNQSLEKTSADLRSMLWLEAASAGGNDWRVFETDPGFAVLAVSEATVEAELATSEETSHAVFDGLHDPVIVRNPGGDVAQVLWPVVVDMLIQRTDVQYGLVHSNVRFGTTLLLVPDPAVDGGFLIETTAVPDGFIQHSYVVVPAS